MKKQKYQVKVHSCKKDTNVTMFLDDKEYQLISELAVATQLESKSECEPTIFIEKVTKITVQGVEEQNV